MNDRVSDGEVGYDLDGHVATITINRPGHHNTISQGLLGELAGRLTDAEADPSVRVVILTGAGRFFCTGLDLSAGDGADGTAPVHLDLHGYPPNILHRMDTPTICALNGSAAGYGMDLALCCDLRVMAEEAVLSAAFTRRGVLPESGGTWILPRLLGWSTAAEIVFTGRTLAAAECLQRGLVSAVEPGPELLGAARALAEEIACSAPLAVQAAKRMMRIGLGESFDDHSQRVYQQLRTLFGTEDFIEGVTAFRERRPPRFEGR